MRIAVIVVAAGLLATACGEDDGASTQPTAATAATVATVTTTGPTPVASSSTPAPTSAAPAEDGCADVIAVEAERTGDTYSFAVTVASGDTGWDKYADAWVVRAPDGTVLGERVLTHPHVDEQPFTRSLGGVVVPEGVDSVIVAARDSVLGFCGREMPFPIGAVGGG